ncbi:MAG: uroporphyrinogen-III synthase [Campylobacteraceae bacterium]|nr:uroporphyrinogen-III synthase [Campylobacteraceae bacterium]
MNNIYILNNLKFKDIINLEVFKINYLQNNLNILNYDALIFTSKNAVLSMKTFSEEWINIPSYAIALKTAEVLLNNNSKLVFTGKSSHGNEFAHELVSELKNKKVLYIRAKNTVSNLAEILKNNEINISSCITYETISKNNKKIILKENAIIIFSSPSSIKYFLEQYEWKKTYKAVVIGSTTAKYLPSYIKYVLSPQTSLEKCIELAKEINIK